MSPFRSEVPVYLFVRGYGAGGNLYVMMHRVGFGMLLMVMLTQASTLACAVHCAGMHRTIASNAAKTSCTGMVMEQDVADNSGWRMATRGPEPCRSRCATAAIPAEVRVAFQGMRMRQSSHTATMPVRDMLGRFHRFQSAKRPPGDRSLPPLSHTPPLRI